jgi:outer membrane autotransporter protein
MTAADNMNVGINNMNLTGTFATTANTQLTYRVNTPTTSGKITAGGEATVVSGTRVNMIVDTNVYVSQGQEFILIDGAESGGHVETLAAGNLTTTNTALLHFKQKITDTNNLVVYADRLQMNVAATIPNNQSVGAVLEKIGGSSDPDIYALQVALGKLDTVQQVEEKLATLIPNVSGAATSSIVSVGTSTGSIMNTRVASLRAGESYGSGMAAGNGAEGGHFWGQVFGSTADQDRRQRIAGYDSDTYGTVLGVDTEFWDNIRTGLAFAYASTDVSGHDANRTQTDINSYQLSLYSDYDLPDSYYLTGQISYMYSDIDSTRYNVAQLAGNNAHADYSSNQYSIRSEVGREWRVDGTRFSLTPAGTFNYTYVDVEGYSERGAGGLSLRDVASDDLQILEFGGKLKVEAKFEDHAGGSITPNLHAGYAYDVIGDKVATSARFAGGGTAFQTEGFEPAQHTLSGGAGLTWKTASDFELNLNYDYEYKSDYEAHSGFVRAGYKF